MNTSLQKPADSEVREVLGSQGLHLDFENSIRNFDPEEMVESTPHDVRQDVDPTQLPSPLPPVPLGMPQTGPKGVIADAHLSREQAMLSSERKQAAFEAQLSSEAMVGKSLHVPTSTTNTEVGGMVGSQDNTHLDFSDEEAFQKYRQQRIAEMRGSTRPVYGTVSKITLTQFVPFIDGTPKEARLIVFLLSSSPEYQDVSKAFAKEIRSLCKRYAFARFGMVEASEVGFDEDMTPCAIWYEGGDCKGSAPKCWDGEGDVEEVLLSQEVLRARDERQISDDVEMSDD